MADLRAKLNALSGKLAPDLLALLSDIVDAVEATPQVTGPTGVVVVNTPPVRTSSDLARDFAKHMAARQSAMPPLPKANKEQK